MSGANWEIQLEGLVYGEHIRVYLEMMFEDWMSDEDKIEFIRDDLKNQGITLSRLDEEIQAAVSNGFPANLQLELMLKTIGSKHCAKHEFSNISATNTLKASDYGH